MNTIGVVLLAAATATSGIGKPHVGGHRLLRHHAVADGPAPPGGPVMMGAGCQFGHQGCGGGAGCSGAAGLGGGPGGMGFGASNRRFPNTRSQVFFVDPPGMRIGWQTAGGGVERVYLPGQLTVPARYNFNQGFIYRLKLSDIPGRPGLVLYPTLEVAPSTPATDAYLTHNPIPAQFTEEDFDQVQAGNFVTKVIYLPDPKFQELAIAGVETLVSTRLEPGVDPILEADRRGTILMIVRVGAIDLEMPVGGGGAGAVAPGAVQPPVMMAPGSAPGTVLPPGSLPPGGSPFQPNVVPTPAPETAPVVPVDPAAPVDAVPSTTPPPTPAPATPPAPAPGDDPPPVPAEAPTDAPAPPVPAPPVPAPNP